MQRKTNFTSLLILLIGVLLLVVDQYMLGNQIPSWVFILILIAWLAIKIRDFRNMRKK